MSEPNWDAIIVGAGHNGLVTAAYLARAGHRVLVLERRHLVGGAAVTEEIVPGFRFSRLSYVNSLFREQIIADLNLHQHGFEMLPRNPSSFSPFPDGRYLILGPDAGLVQREIGKFSARDAERYPRYEVWLETLAAFIESTLDMTPPAIDSPGFADVQRLLELGNRARKLGGRDLQALTEILTGDAMTILDRWFESDQLKVTIATDAIIGAMASPSMPGTAYVLLHHVMGTGGGARGIWGYVRGGMGALSDAIAASARGFGAEIRTGSPVAAVLVEGDRAAGVVTEAGDEYRARVVISNADPNVTFNQLVPSSALPADFLTAINQIDYRSATIKINVALAELPDFTALPGQNGPQHRGTVHISPDIEYVERAYDDAKYGRPSTNPIIEMTLPTAVDDSLAPEGKHIASLFVQYAPFDLAEGTWDELKEPFADRVFDIINDYAPNFKAAVIGRDVVSPLDMQREYSLTGGNIFHGAMSLPQMFFFRPVAGFAQYRSPLRGLYMCGSGTHPGGGVMGAPGANAAREILADLRRNRV